MSAASSPATHVPAGNPPVRHFDIDRIFSHFHGSNVMYRQHAQPFHDTHGVAHIRCKLCLNTYTVQFGGVQRNTLKIASFISHFSRSHPELVCLHILLTECHHIGNMGRDKYTYNYLLWNTVFKWIDLTFLLT